MRPLPLTGKIRHNKCSIVPSNLEILEHSLNDLMSKLNRENIGRKQASPLPLSLSAFLRNLLQSSPI